MAGVLEGVRILDLAGESGELCGKLLAGMGADVVKVEPPEGSPTRRIGPFYHDVPDLNRSLHFWHYNLNKRGITCNLETTDGRDLFGRLVAKADVVLETFAPGYLESLGLSYPHLKTVNPGLILTSVTPFGQTGPYAHWKGSDLVGLAMGGTLNICGYDNHSIPPIRCDGNQSYATASVQAAIGTMLALLQAQATGEGQQVDVSVQDCMAITVEFQNLFWMYSRKQVQRQTGRHAMEEITMPSMLRGKDGKLVHWTFRLGDQSTWLNFVNWAKENDYAPEITGEKYMDPSVRERESGMLMDMVLAFVLDKTSQEAYQEGQAHDLWVTPVNAPEDLLADRHFKAREFFKDVHYPELGESFRDAGAPWIFHETPWRIDRRAPLLGEHNIEIYQGELGLSQAQLVAAAETRAI